MFTIVFPLWLSRDLRRSPGPCCLAAILVRKTTGSGCMGSGQRCIRMSGRRGERAEKSSCCRWLAVSGFTVPDNKVSRGDVCQRTRCCAG